MNEGREGALFRVRRRVLDGPMNGQSVLKTSGFRTFRPDCARRGVKPSRGFVGCLQAGIIHKGIEDARVLSLLGVAEDRRRENGVMKDTSSVGG